MVGSEECDWKPGEALQLVDVFDLGGEVAAEGEDGGGEKSGQWFEIESAAGKGVCAPCGNQDMNDDADLNGDRRGEKDERPVERVEDSGL